MGKLNDKQIQAIKPAEKQVKYSDGDGLTLVVMPSGSKLWQLRYRIGGRAGKEKTLSIGQYPFVSLKEAREQAIQARKLIANGADPSKMKQEARAAAVEAETKAAVDSTEAVETISREWFQKFSSGWVDSHADRIIRRLERDLFPWVGSAEIKSITPASLLSVLRRVESRGALETAHRLLQNCGQIWRYAVATGRVERDITGDLKGALPPAKETHLGAITEPKEIATLLRSIDDYRGGEIVKIALKIIPYLFVRPGELRHAEWEEFDFENLEWVIPEGKMKARRPHVVPLSSQVMALLEELKVVSGNGKYLFPSPTSKSRPMSDMALLTAIRRMGYGKNEMTAHGFRAMASTNLEHLGYDVRLIELQLAHVDQNEVRAAYKRDVSRLQLPLRRQMMQRWADYLDQLKSGAKIYEFRSLEG